MSKEFNDNMRREGLAEIALCEQTEEELFGKILEHGENWAHVTDVAGKVIDQCCENDDFLGALLVTFGCNALRKKVIHRAFDIADGWFED